MTNLLVQNCQSLEDGSTHAAKPELFTFTGIHFEGCTIGTDSSGGVFECEHNMYIVCPDGTDFLRVDKWVKLIS